MKHTCCSRSICPFKKVHVKELFHYTIKFDIKYMNCYRTHLLKTCIVTPIQYNTKRGLDHSFFQFIKEVISNAVGNSSCFLPKMKFLPARLVEKFFLIKGAKLSIILKNVLCCTISITAAVMLGSPDTDPTFYFFTKTDTFAYFLRCALWRWFKDSF